MDCGIRCLRCLPRRRHAFASPVDLTGEVKVHLGIPMELLSITEVEAAIAHPGLLTLHRLERAWDLRQ